MCRTICQGGSKVGDALKVKFKGKQHSARVCAVGERHVSYWQDVSQNIEPFKLCMICIML